MMQETRKLLHKVAIELLSVKRRAHLVSFFDTTLKSDIKYAQAAIYILDSNNYQLNNLLQTNDLAPENSVFSPSIQLKELSVDEIILDDSLELPGFRVFDIGENWHTSTLNKYFWQAPSQGSRILAFSLKDGNDFIGNLLLLFDKASHFLPDNTDLLKLVALTINMTVIHVITEERMTTMGKNAHILEPLNLSVELMRVRDYEQLKRLVQERLLSYFEAVSCVIILRNGSETCRCLLVANDPVKFNNTITEDTYAGSFSQYAHFFEKIIDDEKFVYYNQETLVSMAINAPHLQAELSNGIREKISYPLSYEGRNMGMVFLNYAHKNGLANLEESAVKLVLSQFIRVLFQLVDQEQVRTSIARQDMVIRLGVQIASVRSHEDLLKVISENLKQIIGFTQTSITAINNDKSTANAFLLDYHEVSLHQADYSWVVSKRHAINDGFLDKVLQSDEPLAFDLEKLIRIRLLPSYLKIKYDSGTRHVVIAKFLKGTEAFGFWLLTFDNGHEITTSTLQLIRDVASQVSVSVQNIMINLADERREKEINHLMQFSHAIASIQDREKLVKIIKEHLKVLFGIDDFLLWSLSNDLQYRSPVLFDKTSLFIHHPCFQSAPEKQFSNADEIYDVLLEREGITYVNAIDLSMAYADHPYFSTETNPIVSMGGSVLRVGDEVIGMLTFFTQHIHLVQEKEELFLSICSQLAIMASTMITSDKISEQLAEIKRYNERLEDEKIYLLRELELPANNSDMIGHSTGIQAVLKLIQQVAYTDSTVLILGETGTGKELVARSVHSNSPRKSKLMVKVNCAALPASLVESELFGHEKGSFTGASERRIGKFELANQGTLFLDEIGEMPLDLQGKLLRALQEKEIERIGGKAVIKVDVRVIVATNRNLEKEVAQGTFRSDLFYRINVFPIRLPPLRDRLSDIPLLASYFITKYAGKVGKDIKSLSSTVLQELQRHNWPGNIRELEHVIERSVLLTKGDTLKVVDVPESHLTLHDGRMYLDKKIMTLDENERDHILRIIKLCRGRINGQNGAAVLLGIPPSTLNSKMKRLAISKQEIRS